MSRPALQGWFRFTRFKFRVRRYHAAILIRGYIQLAILHTVGFILGA